MPAQRRSHAPKPATEQPGNSFKYLYWRLSEKQFQQLCSALLRNKYGSVRCFPVGMADEGIDAVSGRGTIYQVKWSTKLLQDPGTWLADAIEGERAKIINLIEEQRVSRYILMTSVAGTTTANGTGSIQKLQEKLDEYTEEFGVPVECWWQSDIDAEVDVAPDSLKWAYPEMLAGVEAMRYLIHGSQAEGQAAQMRDTILQVMASQWREDAKIKFSQVDMDRTNLADLFVDVNASLQHAARNAVNPSARVVHYRKQEGSSGAVALMLRTTYPLTFLVGIPGQGKSTLSQYLSQIHRAAILPGSIFGDRKPPYEHVENPKLPLRIDLKDYAAWLSGQDPFGEDDPPRNPRRRRKDQRSLELFLAGFCSALSGSRQVTVEDVQSLLARYPTLLVLDGLDEVADAGLRAIVVEQINATATRMGASGSTRQFQILVTARPNASGLAEPDGDIFQTLRLDPLTPPLQGEFINKWCEINDIHGKARRDLRRTFLNRVSLPQVAQLADNPMYLTILLFLINRKGDAVPVSPAPLFTDYMATLLDREVSRKQIGRDQVPRVQEVTAFLGWHMHSGVETEPDAGRMTQEDIETTLLVYFRRTEGPEQEAKNLFQAASDRFWALTSKVDGTFEFAVQPVREYFAARFLAEWAGRDRRAPLPKQEILRRLIDRTYWLNVARFYAGFAPPNELAGLRYGLEEAITGNRHPLQERAAAWALLGDGIFASNSPVQRDVARLLTDDLTVCLAADHPNAEVNFPRLAHASGGKDIATELMRGLESDPCSPLSDARVFVLRHRVGLDPQAFLDWWTPRLQTAIGTPAESAWLNIGGSFGVPRLLHRDAGRLTLDSPEQCQAALWAGASPDAGTDADKRLLRAVLDGWCSDVRTSSSSEAGALLRAMRPQWYHQLGDGRRDGPAPSTGHLWLHQAGRTSRSSAWTRLLDLNPRYARLKKAANLQGRGQKGTTEPWQNTARELARLHGPCWLAAEIAIAGAAAPDIIGSGSLDRGGEPLGGNIDYGTFVLEVHHHPDTAWWKTLHDQYGDSLSRRTWALALLATADTDVVIDHLNRIDACLAGLSDHEFFAVVSSSSRLGVTQTHRRLEHHIWDAAAGLGPRTKLLIAHFAAGLGEYDLLTPLHDTELEALASPEAAAWPIAGAVTVRLQLQPNATLLRALAALGPAADLALPPDPSPPSTTVVNEILHSPERYPSSWLAATERWHSMAHQEPALEQVILDEKWIPKVPRL